MAGIAIDKGNDALIIVDLQNDFCPGGALAVPDGNAIVPVVNSLIDKFEVVFTTQDWHPDDHVSFRSQGGRWPAHCVAGTAGAELHPSLKAANAHRILKGNSPAKDAYSGFEDTDLADRLKKRGIKRIFVCGLATDYCVKATAIDGLKHGFKVVVVGDAVRGVDASPGDSERAIEEMSRAGAEIVESTELS